MMQKASALNYKQLNLLDGKTEDLNRYHIALQYGRAVHQNQATCFVDQGGFWTTKTRRERLEETMSALHGLLRTVNLRGQFALLRPWLACRISLLGSKSSARASSA